MTISEIGSIGLDVPASVTCDQSTVSADIATACSCIAPLWPLDHFIAVNPFLGMIDQPFMQAMQLAELATATEFMWPSHHPAPRDGNSHHSRANDHRLPSLTLAGFADQVLNTRWNAFIVEEMSSFFAARFDQGVARWPMPWQSESLYSAWCHATALDHSARIQGLSGMHEFLRQLPHDPLAVIESAVAKLQLPASCRRLFFYAELMSLSGWSGYLQYLAWDGNSKATNLNNLRDLLAIRLAWDLALDHVGLLPADRQLWRDNLQRANDRCIDSPPPGLTPLCDAEIRYQHELLHLITRRPDAPEPPASPRPSVQAVFCIDVRSEPYRRKLEAIRPDCQTIGFAGFFGIPLNFMPSDGEPLQRQYPVLLKSDRCLCESAIESRSAAQDWRRGLSAAWKDFKTSGLPGFSFVESAGVLFLYNIIQQILPRGRPALTTGKAGMRFGEKAALAPDGTGNGLTLEQQVQLAAGALRNMGLASRQARLVLFCGHGSTTTANPHASSLNCGACGGNTGEFNARVAAAILNNPLVRESLAKRSIQIADDTWFVAALHDTTTDDVSLLDTDLVPASHQQELMRLNDSLQQASVAARKARAASLGLSATQANVDSQIRRRARDWSQVRPEWGLAGNAAFLAGTRSLTRGLDLKGRVFLHDYDYRADADGQLLELILTAPLVVASWINLQYFASTVCPDRFGSGTKVLHNIAANIGVYVGNGGDLRTGLPLESLHDGQRWVHEPLRLTALIQAPTAMIDQVINRHKIVEHLLDNQWLHLIAISASGRRFQRYTGEKQWSDEALE
jgi:uncharacterized protein YbcC (UPF0753/DUF2309 family)